MVSSLRRCDVFRFRKPVQPSDDNPIEMLSWYYQYVRWAWKTITTLEDIPFIASDSPLSPRSSSRLMDFAGKAFIGLSGVVISIFATVVLQMFGVDDPLAGHLTLAAMCLWMLGLCVILLRRYVTTRLWRVVGPIMCAAILVASAVKVDEWFMDKRKQRGTPFTPRDFVDVLKREFPSMSHEPQPPGSVTSKSGLQLVAVKAPCREQSLKNCSPRELRDRVLRLTQNMQNLITNIERENKDAIRIENEHIDDSAAEQEQTKKYAANALKFLTATEMKKYRALYMNSAISYRAELVSRLGPPAEAIPEHSYGPIEWYDWYELNGVVRELRDMANELKDVN
jgi:hypothetical protein